MEQEESSLVFKRAKRKKIVLECPNPLFVKWLKEWRDQAVDKGWKIQHTYSRALKSLEKYPLPLKSPWEAIHLNYFGDKICKMLEEKLKEHGGNLEDIREFPVDEFSSEGTTSNNCTKLQSRNNTNKNSASYLSKSKQKKQCNKKYVPVPRTGSYAILITLMRNEADDDKTFMKKQEIIDSAQSLSDASFTRPVPGSHYTAWSTMGNLIRKGLVIKYGNPAKYTLTEKGRELAISLTEPDGNNLDQINSNNKNADEILDMDLQERNNDIRKKVQNKQIETTGKIYKFIDIDGKETDDCRRALRIKDDLSGFIGFLIKCNRKQLIDSGMRYKIDETRLMIGEEIYAYLHKNDCNRYRDVLNNIQLSSNNQAGLNNKENEKRILYPGTFDVILVVDNCEVCTSSSNDHRIEVLKELTKMEVKHDVRKLYVGDFLWIAKKCNSVKENYEDELVLDYIVERKRMDDLAKSIKDGRFYEQKFRIKETGIKHPIYLVEEYGTNQYFGLPDASLKQAVVNCQVVDRFLVTKTKNIKSTVKYLATMTRYLQSLYNKKEITSCSREDYVNSANNSNCFITFKEFNSLAVKRKQLLLKEMFAKHLLQIGGMSADKAYALVQKYPTPSRLIEAYNSCSRMSERENLISEISYGINRRKIGPILSQTVFRLYCNQSPSLKQTKET